jgi:hypothetical protein
MKKTQVILIDCPWGHVDGVRTEMPVVASRLLMEGISLRVETPKGTSRARLMVAKRDKLKAEQIHNGISNLPNDERFRPVQHQVHNLYPLGEVTSGIFSYVYDNTGLIPVVVDQGDDFVEISSI